MSNQLKCGIVGYGYMGEIRKRVIEQHPRLVLSGICCRKDSVHEDLAGYPVCNTLEELFKKDIDIVFVCTPNKYAPEICTKSILSNKHVFCEKPPGRTLQDVQAIMAAEKVRPDIKLMFGFNHRFHPAMIRAKEIVDSGDLGKIINVRGLYGKSGGVNFRDSWRNNKEMSGGGILLDQGIHMLDLFRYYCGDFESVKCFTSNSFWKFDVEDNAYVILKNEKGQCGTFHSSATLWKHTFRLEITLEQGYITVEGLLSKTGSYGREKITIAKRQFEDEAKAVGNPQEEIIAFDKDLSWDLEVQEFVRCIDENRPITKSSSQDALKAMEIVDKAYKDCSRGPGDVDYCTEYCIMKSP